MANTFNFSIELVNFFARANLGPRIVGSFRVIQPGERRLVDRNSLEPVEEMLNTALPFTQKKSSLYRVSTCESLVFLFALHASHEKMITTANPNRLCASRQMREYLSPLIGKAIRRNIRRMKERYVKNKLVLDQITKAFPLLIEAINNPEKIGPELGVINDENGKKTCELFNPNWFRYCDFNKLISAAKEEERIGMEPLLTDQNDVILLARAYKE